ncbi:TPA: hypothetical protein QC364_000759 [Bacillus cereus]|nr:hypothetical protein [Bacillus cereus]
MRDILNLKTLKRSKLPKHKTIYKKAHRLINEDYATPDLTNEEILEIAKDFPTLSVNIIVGGDISIKSIVDSWIIKDEGRFYTLYHSALVSDNGRYKERFHLQDVFKDLNYIFASVVSHDDFAMGIQRRNEYDVLEMIS